jgi:hypothetical protein
MPAHKQKDSLVHESDALPYQGFTTIAVNPETGDWVAPAPALDPETYCAVAEWTAQGYRFQDGQIFTGDPMEF